jgi:sulfite exporter TauE/SafE
MDNPLTYTSAFLLGLFSTLHCIGMCGGIIGALSLSLPLEIRQRKTRMLLFIASYNIGRIISYSLAGLVAGALGTGLLKSVGFDQGHTVLRVIGVAMMIAIGLYLTGWLPQLAIVEKIGVPVWKRLEPLGRRLLPVATLPKALGYGLIWGWLPCGMVYFVLIWALATGNPVEGALTMLAFGLGTLPTLLATGFMTSWLTRFARSATARQVVGLLIIAMAIGSLFIPMDGQMAGHHHH